MYCVIPAGGLSLDHTHWVKSRDRFFLPIHVLRRVFRGKFVAALLQAFRDHQLVFHGNLTLLAQPSTFAAWLRSLFRKDWVVYSKPPFGGPEYVLQYVGCYTHCVAEGTITRWRDSAHNNEQKLLTLSLDEFLPLPVARASQRFRAHPELRLPRQPATRQAPAALLSCSAQRRRQSKTSQAAKTQVIFGAVQNAVDR